MVAIPENKERVTESKVFRMSAGRFMTEMIFRYSAPWLLLLCAIGLTGIVFGIILDYRWLLAALFLVFIIAPALVMLLYYYFGLRREAYVNTIPHIVVLTDKGMIMRLRIPLSAPDSCDAGGAGTDGGEEKEYRWRDEFFAYTEMLPMRTGMKSVSVPLKAPAKGILWIPREAFGSDDEMAGFLEVLDSHLS